MLPPPQFKFPTPRDIERLAFEAGVSISALCERAGVSTQAFRNWKFGRVSPTLSTAQKLTEAGLALLAEAEAPASGVAVAVRVKAKATPAKRRPRAKAKATPVALQRQMRRMA
jgi:predicted transcriptional regulator